MVICETTVRGGRASKDGLAASRRANTMASLCEWISANAKLLTTEITDPKTLLFNTFLSQSMLRMSLNLQIRRMHER
jgi:hypothetical protein